MLKRGAEISPKVPGGRTCKGQDSHSEVPGVKSLGLRWLGPAASATRVSPGTLEMGSSSVTWSGDTRSSISWAQTRPWLSMMASFREASSTVYTPSSSPRQNVTRCWRGRGESRESQEDAGVGGSHQPSHPRPNTIPESLPHLGLHQWGPSSQGPEFCFHLSDQPLSPASPHTGGSLKAPVLSSPL